MFSRFPRIFFTGLRNFSGDVAGPIQIAITEKLSRNFLPSHLKVQCESRMHQLEKGAEKHFRVQIVSKKFEGLSLLQMHKLVNDCLAEELSDKIHAIRLKTYSPSKFKNTNFLQNTNFSVCKCKALPIL